MEKLIQHFGSQGIEYVVIPTDPLVWTSRHGRRCVRNPVSVFVTSAYYSQEWSIADAPRWALLLQRELNPLFTFAPPYTVYQTYGKGFFLVFLLFLTGLLGLRAQVHERIDPRGHLGLRIALIGLVLSLIGNVSDYWLGENIPRLISVIGFVIGTEIGYLVYLGGALLLGRAILRRDLLPRWIMWALVSAPLLGIFFTPLIGQIPSGFIFPISLSWVVIGYALSSASSG